MHSKYKIEQTEDGTGYLLVDPDGFGEGVLGRYDTLLDAQVALSELENRDRYEYTLFDWADPAKFDKASIDSVAQDVVLGLLAGKIVCSKCGAKHSREKFTIGITRWIGRDTPGEMSVDLQCTAINEEATQYCGHGGLYTFNENPLFEKKLKAGAEEFTLTERTPTIGYDNYALDA